MTGLGAAALLAALACPAALALLESPAAALGDPVAAVLLAVLGGLVARSLWAVGLVAGALSVVVLAAVGGSVAVRATAAGGLVVLLGDMVAVAVVLAAGVLLRRCWGGDRAVWV